MDDFLADNVEWLLLIVAYAAERLQEVKRRKKLKSDSPVVETEQSKVRKATGFLVDLLPLVSRFKRRKK